MENKSGLEISREGEVFDVSPLEQIGKKEKEKRQKLKKDKFFGDKLKNIQSGM